MKEYYQEESTLSQRLCFPVNHFPPTILQRKKFYSDEFAIGQVKQWFHRLPEPLRNPIFSVDVGAESGIVRKKYSTSAGSLILFSVRDLDDLRYNLVDYCPEDTYYDRNLYEDKEKCLKCRKLGKKNCASCTNIVGQHLMFDIDPENIDCPNCGTLGERIRRKSMYQFCYICFRKAAIYTRRLHGILLSKGYINLEVIYSGRGFHIYIEDPSAYELRFQERDALAKWVKEEQHIPIDPWVTRGGTRFARLPYSLHGLVGKVVTPVKAEALSRLNPTRDDNLTPQCLKNQCT